MDVGNHPLLRSLHAWAGTRDDVVELRLTGSREAEEGTGDSVADFDVELHVDDPRTWHGEGWLEEIAPVLVAGEPASADDPSRLVFFNGQQRVDFRIVAGGGAGAGRAPGPAAPPRDQSLVRDRAARTAEAERGPASSAPPAPPASVPVAAAGPGVAGAHPPAPAAAELFPTAPPPATLLALEPVFSTSDVPGWLAHYRALGFQAAGDRAGGGLASRDGLVLRVVPDPASSPGPRGLAVVAVDDVEALLREWAAVPAGRTTGAAADPDGPARGVHADPSGNVLRIVQR